MLHRLQIDREAYKDWVALEGNFDIYLVVISLSFYDLHFPAYVCASMWLFDPIAFIAFVPISYLRWRMRMNQGDGLMNDEWEHHQLVMLVLL